MSLPSGTAALCPKDLDATEHLPLKECRGSLAAACVKAMKKADAEEAPAMKSMKAMKAPASPPNLPCICRAGLLIKLAG